MSEPRESSPAFVVGSMGGKTTFTIADTRLAVDVPPAALVSTIALTAMLRPDPPPGHIGPVFELGPSGTRFREPVTLRVAPPPLPSGLSFADLAWATEENGKWIRLPTRPGPGGTLEGETTHFSTFALVSNCHDAGTKRSFALTGCPVFDPTITTSLDVTLDATAGRQTLILRFGAGTGTVTVKVQGLTPGHLYFRYEDSFKNESEAKADSTGTVTFQQELADPHTVILQWSHGSIDLAPTTCPVFLGTFDAATATCTMDRDVEESIAIYDPNLTLDCAGHQLGSNQVPRSIGIWVSEGAQRATIKNCTLVNHDMGIVAARTKRLTVINTTIKTLERLPEGVIAVGIDHSETASFAGLSVERYRFGVMARSAIGLDARRVAFRTRGAGLVLATGGSAILRGVELEGDAPEGPFASVGIVFADEGTFGELHGVTGRNLGSTAAGIRIDSAASGIVRNAVIEGPMVGLFLGRGPASEVSDSTFTRCDKGIDVDGQHHLFHNNIHGNLVQAYASSPGELSDTRPASPTFRQGNYWGRSCPASLFVPGIDSTRMDAVDSYPYGAPNAWATGGAPGCAIAPTVLAYPVDNTLLNNPRPTFSGRAEASSRVEIIEGLSVLATALADASGEFSIIPASALAEGAHTIVAKATAGAKTATSPAVRFTIDTIPPAKPVIKTPQNGATLTTSLLNVTGTADPLTGVEIRSGSTVLATATSDATGYYSAVGFSPITSGTVTLIAVAFDDAGNVSADSAPVTVTLAPVATAFLVGTNGQLKIDSIKEQPNPFLPAAGQVLTLEAKGTVRLPQQQSHGAGSKYDFTVERAFVDPRAATVVRSVSRTLPITTQPSQMTASVAASVSWDGKDASGNLVPAGAYTVETRFAVVRNKAATGGSATKPPDCRGQPPSTSGPCVLDAATFVGTVAVLPATLALPANSSTASLATLLAQLRALYSQLTERLDSGTKDSSGLALNRSLVDQYERLLQIYEARAAKGELASVPSSRPVEQAAIEAAEARLDARVAPTAAEMSALRSALAAFSLRPPTAQEAFAKACPGRQLPASRAPATEALWNGYGGELDATWSCDLARIRHGRTASFAALSLAPGRATAVETAQAFIDALTPAYPGLASSLPLAQTRTVGPALEYRLYRYMDADVFGDHVSIEVIPRPAGQPGYVVNQFHLDWDDDSAAVAKAKAAGTPDDCIRVVERREGPLDFTGRIHYTLPGIRGIPPDPERDPMMMTQEIITDRHETFCVVPFREKGATEFFIDIVKLPASVFGPMKLMPIAAASTKLQWQVEQSGPDGAQKLVTAGAANVILEGMTMAADGCRMHFEGTSDDRGMINWDSTGCAKSGTIRLKNARVRHGCGPGITTLPAALFPPDGDGLTTPKPVARKESNLFTTWNPFYSLDYAARYFDNTLGMPIFRPVHYLVNDQTPCSFVGLTESNNCNTPFGFNTCLGTMHLHFRADAEPHDFFHEYAHTSQRKADATRGNCSFAMATAGLGSLIGQATVVVLPWLPFGRESEAFAEGHANYTATSLTRDATHLFQRKPAAHPDTETSGFTSVLTYPDHFLSPINVFETCHSHENGDLWAAWYAALRDRIGRKRADEVIAGSYFRLNSSRDNIRLVHNRLPVGLSYFEALDAELFQRHPGARKQNALALVGNRFNPNLVRTAARMGRGSDSQVNSSEAVTWRPRDPSDDPSATAMLWPGRLVFGEVAADDPDIFHYRVAAGRTYTVRALASKPGLAMSVRLSDRDISGTIKTETVSSTTAPFQFRAPRDGAVIVRLGTSLPSWTKVPYSIVLEEKNRDDSVESVTGAFSDLTGGVPVIPNGSIGGLGFINGPGDLDRFVFAVTPQNGVLLRTLRVDVDSRFSLGGPRRTGVIPMELRLMRLEAFTPTQLVPGPIWVPVTDAETDIKGDGTVMCGAAACCSIGVPCVSVASPSHGLYALEVRWPTGSFLTDLQVPYLVDPRIEASSAGTLVHYRSDVDSGSTESGIRRELILGQALRDTIGADSTQPPSESDESDVYSFRAVEGRHYSVNVSSIASGGGNPKPCNLSARLRYSSINTSLHREFEKRDRFFDDDSGIVPQAPFIQFVAPRSAEYEVLIEPGAEDPRCSYSVQVDDHGEVLREAALPPFP